MRCVVISRIFVMLSCGRLPLFARHRFDWPLRAFDIGPFRTLHVDQCRRAWHSSARRGGRRDRAASGRPARPATPMDRHGRARCGPARCWCCRRRRSAPPRIRGAPCLADAAAGRTLADRPEHAVSSTCPGAAVGLQLDHPPHASKSIRFPAEQIDLVATLAPIAEVLRQRMRTPRLQHQRTRSQITIRGKTIRTRCRCGLQICRVPVPAGQEGNQDRRRRISGNLLDLITRCRCKAVGSPFQRSEPTSSSPRCSRGTVASVGHPAVDLAQFRGGRETPKHGQRCWPGGCRTNSSLSASMAMRPQPAEADRTANRSRPKRITP